MKRIISVFILSIAFYSCIGQLIQGSTINAKGTLIVNTKKVTGISSDTTAASKSDSKLITEAAAKKYADKGSADSNTFVTFYNLGTRNYLSGAGSTNYLQKRIAGSNLLGNSNVYDDGVNVGIKNSSPTEVLDVIGNIKLTGVIKDDTYGGTVITPGNDLKLQANNNINLDDGLIVKPDSTLQLPRVPITSGAGTYEYLTRNTTTGNVEKVVSGGGVADSTWYSSVNVKSFGAIPGDGLDDWAAFQAAANYATTNKIATYIIPVGTWNLSKGVEFIRMNADSTQYENVMITITGDANQYDNNVGGGTKVILSNATDFAFGIMKGKGCTIKNLFITGMNTGLINMTLAELSLPGTSWVSNGVQENKRAPHAAIAIDPYGSSAIANVNRYPGRLSRYMHDINSGSGSTDIKVENVSIRDFYCGVSISANGTSQNAEGIVLERMFFQTTTVAVATGNSQTRTCVLRDSYAWVRIRSVIDGTFGQGISAPCWIQGFLNIAGGVKYLINAPSWRQDVFFENVYAELLYAIGGNFASVNSNFYFKNCSIDFMGSFIDAGQTIRNPLSILNCSSASFIGGRLGRYGNAGGPLNIDSDVPTLLVGVVMDQPLFSKASYVGCVIPTTNNSFLIDDKTDIKYLRDQLNYSVVVIPNSRIKILGEWENFEREVNTRVSTGFGMGKVLTVNVPANQTTFLAWPSEAARMYPGDRISIYKNTLTDDFGLTSSQTGNNFPFPSIDSIVWNGVDMYIVYMNGIYNGIVSGETYDVYTYRLRKFKATHIGDVTQYSNVITNVIREGNTSVVGLQVGDNIVHPAFQNGAYVTAKTDSTITVSGNPATGTYLQTAIITADYKQTSYNSNTTTFAIPTAFKRGDRIINTGADTTISYWECVSDGITSSAKLPIFKKMVLTPL